MSALAFSFVALLLVGPVPAVLARASWPQRAPRAAIVLWQKMAKASNGAPPQWLSTHPSNETRQQDLRVYAERVMPLYEQATQGARPVK